MSAKKVAVAKKGVWQHISHDEYYRDIVGLCAQGTVPRDILRKHIVTKQEIVDTWGPRHTGPSGNAHGGFSINAPTAKHLRSRVKELWAQIFLKKRVTNQQITEELAAGILAESKDPESVDWVAFAADKMKKHWSRKLEKGLVRSSDRDGAEKEASGDLSCEGEESEVEGESDNEEEELKQDLKQQESGEVKQEESEEAKQGESEDEQRREEVSKEKEERSKGEDGQRATSTGKDKLASVEEPLAIEEAL
jgi:hypothetical protein